VHDLRQATGGNREFAPADRGAINSLGGNRTQFMTLKELSVQYRVQAGRLRERIRDLELQQKSCGEEETAAMQQRIHTLHTLWKEARDLAVLTERYYERGYHRNEQYTL
jgi:hypothetical protein